MADLNILSVKQPYQASKWLKLQALVDPEELRALLGNAKLYSLSGILNPVVPYDLLSVYSRYIDEFKQGKEAVLPDFGLAATLDLEALYAFSIPQGFLIKQQAPVVQITPHKMDFNRDDQSFKSNLYGPETMSWGVQFSYPQQYEFNDGEIRKASQAINGQLYKSIQKSLREITVPTAFLIEGKKIQSTFRLGKNCLEWVNRHPQFKKKNIQVII